MNTEKIGTFVISIDLEYGWGYWDQSLGEEEKEKIRGETDIIHRLLTLFDQYEIPATWAVVGKLLEEGDDPLWHDSAHVVEKIRAKEVGHEIGSHSYGHILYGEESSDDVERDIRAARDIHGRHNLPFSTFIFPRNSEGHHALLQEYGITSYRGKTEHWYMRLPGALSRLFHLLDYCIPFAPTVTAQRTEAGMITIPDSMLLLGRKGIRNFVPPACMQKKAHAGLIRAARNGEIFHLWFHPSNFSVASDTQFRILESILVEAHRLRSSREIQILTMRDIAQAL